MENNNNNNDSIRKAVEDYFNNIRLNIAQAIRKHDWPTVGWNSLFVLAIVLVAVALSVVVLALVWRIFSTLLGKIFAVPLVLFILGLSYKMNLEDSRKLRQTEHGIEHLEQWAGKIYPYVRDSMFYVIQALASKTSVAKPNTPSDIEIRNGFFRRGKYMVFQFFVQWLTPLPKDKFEKKFTDTMFQMHREHKLVGISPDLVEIDHLLYCPLQVLNIEPCDDGYIVEIVLADKETIALVDRAQQRNRKIPGPKLFEDELQ